MEKFNRVQLNQTIQTNNGNLLINVRADDVDEAMALYSEIHDKLSVDNQGAIQIQSALKSLMRPTSTSIPAVKELNCPNCNKLLVERTAKKTGNKFYGCSGYPQCHFVMAA